MSLTSARATGGAVEGQAELTGRSKAGRQASSPPSAVLGLTSTLAWIEPSRMPSRHPRSYFGRIDSLQIRSRLWEVSMALAIGPAG